MTCQFQIKQACAQCTLAVAASAFAGGWVTAWWDKKSFHRWLQLQKAGKIRIMGFPERLGQAKAEHQ
jgi:hypothetical protein